MKTALLKALIVVTSHAELGKTGKPTGYYLPEVAHPYAAMQEGGLQIDIASPKGGKAPLDPKSLDLKDPIIKRLWDNSEFRNKLENTLPLNNVKAEDYQAIFFAGGHGVMWDFRDDKDMQRLSKDIYEQGGIVSAVCHGPAALIDVKLSNGRYLVDGKRVAAFTDAEEDAVGLTKEVPFLVETELKKHEALHEAAANFQKKIVVDGRLVTGQNPASAQGVGEEVAKILFRK